MPNKKEKKVYVLNFASNLIVPTYAELNNPTKKYVTYGKDNLYPTYLLRLFDNSTKHGSLVKNKAKYIFGKGFDFKDQTDKLSEALKTVNRYGESLNKIMRKIILDNEIFNGFYLQIIWGKGGKITDIIHLDYATIRSNKDNTVFYHKEDWSTARGVITPYPAFNPDSRTGTQILYSKEYRPGIKTYTVPEYLQAMNFIEADILIAEHTFNNAKSGFTASKMITFTDGEPETEDQVTEIERALTDKFTGETGAKLIVNFANGVDKAPKVDDLGASDLTKEDFSQVDELISQNIFKAHQVTSPILFGERVKGQLGARTEMREAYEMFQNTYINSRQQAIEEVINELLAINGLPEGAITQVDPVGYDLTEIVDFAPKKYLFEKVGIDVEEYAEDLKQPMPQQQNPNNNPKNDKQNKKGQNFSEAEDDLAIELFSQFGDRTSDYFRVNSKKVEFMSDEDCVKSEVLAYRNASSEITQLESNIINQLQKDKRATPEVIAKALGVDADLVKRQLTDLEAKGMITTRTEKIGEDEQTITEVTKGGSEATKEKRPLTTEVFVRYSYGGVKDDRNRPFCARMLELDRLYSRADIESISQRLGYSVWERRGGFYHNPKTDITTPYCRHYWVQHIVIKKK